MIAFVRGRLLRLLDKSCLVLTPSGLGYEIFLSARGMAGMPGKDEEVELYTLTVVREDALDLYGFMTPEERETFNALLHTPKLGPRTALAILGMYTPVQLQRIIHSEDESSLALVPGIGIKTARRLILDLKDRLRFIPSREDLSQPGPVAGSVRQDVLTGLTGLGYTAGEIAPMLDRILEKEPDLDVSSAIRAVLREKAREKMQS